MIIKFGREYELRETPFTNYFLKLLRKRKFRYLDNQNFVWEDFQVL